MSMNRALLTSLSATALWLSAATGCGGDDGTILDGAGGASAGAGGGDAAAGSAGTVGEPGGSALPDLEGGILDAALDISADTACGQTKIDKTSKAVNILLVLDKSKSMDAVPAGFAVNKWTAMGQALSGAFTPVAGSLNLGLELFPFATDDAGNDSCAMPDTGGNSVQIPVTPGDAAIAQIAEQLTNQIPNGSTPTALALARALDYFSGDGKNLVGDKYVVLATDGGPNCNTQDACEAEACTLNLDGLCPIEAGNCCAGPGRDACLDTPRTKDALLELQKIGIKTFVVGIPGTEAYQTELDELAIAGGLPASTTSPKYFRVDAAPDAGDGVERLTSVFKTITQQLIVSCRLQLQTEPPDPEFLNVAVDGEAVPYLGDENAPDASSDARSGWRLDQTTTPDTVVLHGPLCTSVQSKGASSVEVLYGCVKRIRPPG